MASRTAAQASMLRASLAAAGHKAASAARKPSRLTAGIAATAATGALAVAVAAPWTSAAGGHAADAHGIAGAPASTASLELAAGHHAATGGAPAQPATAARVTAAHHATARAVAAKHATAKHATAKHAIAKKAAAGPSTIYDSVTPTAIPAGKSVATYSDGPYQASPSSASGHGKVLWIDVNGSNPRADALDVEPGDATPAGAAAWVKAKLTASPHSTAIVYTFKSAWPGVISSISGLPSSMQSHVKYWIADPTGTPHILPGAAATQWYWGASYDITAAHPGFAS